MNKKHYNEETINIYSVHINVQNHAKTKFLNSLCMKFSFLALKLSKHIKKNNYVKEINNWLLPNITKNSLFYYNLFNVKFLKHFCKIWTIQFSLKPTVKYHKC